MWVKTTLLIDLQHANWGDEARELLTTLSATSKQEQAFGHHHNTTKEVTSALKQVSIREDKTTADAADAAAIDVDY